MKFSEFLKTQIDNKLPVQLIKDNFAYFKNTFNLPNKDVIYNNLIDNIVWILETKYGQFELRYNNNRIALNELILILSTQIPQFLFIQKKQLLEALDFFGDINNWGYVAKENVKRVLTGESDGVDSTGYVPIDNDEQQAYSKDTNTIRTKNDDNVDTKTQTTDFLKYFQEMKWNTASLNLPVILRPYLQLFNLINAGVDNIKEQWAWDADLNAVYVEIDKTNDKVIQLNTTIDNAVETVNNMGVLVESANTKAEAALTKVNTFDGRINTNADGITNLNNTKANKTDVFTKSESDNKYAVKAITNSFTAFQNFDQGLNARGDVNIYNDKKFKIGWTPDDVKFEIAPASGENRTTRITLKSGHNLEINQVKTPTNGDQAANKSYVDNKFSGTYTKTESDNKFGLKSVVENNTTRIVGIEDGLRNGNILNYTGPWNSGSTYKIGQAVTKTNKWFVSNVNDNRNHEPDLQGSNQYWELISSGPSVVLDDYYTKNQSDSRYGRISDVQSNTSSITNLSNTKADRSEVYTKSVIDSLKREIYNDMYPVGSLVMTSDGSTHPMVNRYPSKFQELSESDIAYLAIGNNSSSSNRTSFVINQNQLPNVNFVHNHGFGFRTRSNLRPWNFGNGGNVWDGERWEDTGTQYQNIYLNGNVPQQPINIDIKPKTLKIRVWKVISSIM